MVVVVVCRSVGGGFGFVAVAVACCSLGGGCGCVAVVVAVVCRSVFSSSCCGAAAVVMCRVFFVGGGFGCVAEAVAAVVCRVVWTCSGECAPPDSQIEPTSTISGSSSSSSSSSSSTGSSALAGVSPSRTKTSDAPSAPPASLAELRGTWHRMHRSVSRPARLSTRREWRSTPANGEQRLITRNGKPLSCFFRVIRVSVFTGRFDNTANLCKCELKKRPH